MLRNSVRTLRRATVRTVVGGGVILGVTEWTTHLPSQGRSSEFYHSVSDHVVTPFMRNYLDPEVAHTVALSMAQKGLAPRHRPSPSLESRINMETTLSYNNSKHELVFPNPIGLAAGFDKDGECIQPLLQMGFGSVEIGTVTPQPQPGNPKPRMFRLVDDLGIINRYGFNSQGAEVVKENMVEFKRRQRQEEQQQQQDNNNNNTLQSMIWNYVFPSSKQSGGLVGINIGKNKATPQEQAKEDYVHSIKTLGPYADYMVMNISSPNTPNLRDLQQPTAMAELVQACLEARDQLDRPVPPLLIKLAPDLTTQELKDMMPILKKVDGVVVTNTTNQRPDSLLSIQHRDEVGGLSGAPIKQKSTEMIRQLYKLMDGNVFIIGVGGIGSGKDAYEKLKAGASALQIYSMMVYQGPGCVSRIRQELADLMDQNGQKSLQNDVIGRDHEEIFWRKQRQRQYQQQQASSEEPIISS